MITDLLIAVQKSNIAMDLNTQSLRGLLDFVEDMKHDLKTERELRVRIEERLKMDDELRGMFPVAAKRQTRRQAG